MKEEYLHIEFFNLYRYKFNHCHVIKSQIFMILNLLCQNNTIANNRTVI